MVKRKKSSEKPLIPAPDSVTSYAFKPLLIGAIIKGVILEKKLDEIMIVAAMHVSLHTLRAWYKREYLPMPIMMALSKVIDHDLTRHYRADVKPEPDPCKEKDKEIKALRLENTQLENDLRNSRELRTRQEGTIEGLEKALREVTAELVKKNKS